jgi:hypothetical protein
LERHWLDQVEASSGEDEAQPLLAWLAGRQVEISDDELRGPVRRAMLLLAAGGDPPERREALARGLARLRAEAGSLPLAGAALDTLLGEPELAWRAYAAGLLGEELADE